MRQRRASVLFLTVCAILLASWSAGAEVAALTPAEVVQRAIENDVGLKTARLTLDNAEITYKRNVAANALGGSPDALRAAEIEWQRAQETFRTEVANLVIAVVQQIIGLEQSAMAVETAKIRLDQSQIAYERAQQKYDAQIASESELIDARLALAEATLSYESALFDDEEARAALAKRLGLSDVRVRGGFAFVPVAISVEDSLQRAFAIDVGLADAKNRELSARQNLDRLQLEHAPALDLRAAENDLQIAAIRVTTTEEQLRDTVEDAVRTVERAAKNYDIALQRTQIERERYESTQKQVAAGFLTDDSLLSAQINLLQRESSLLDALRSYLVAVMQHERLIGVDVATGAVFQGGS